MASYFYEKIEEENGGLGDKKMSLSKGPECCQETRKKVEAIF